MKWKEFPGEQPEYDGWYFCRVILPGEPVAKYVLKFVHLNGRDVFTDGVLVFPPGQHGYVEWLDEEAD